LWGYYQGYNDVQNNGFDKRKGMFSYLSRCRVYGDFEALEKAEIENKKDHGNLGIPPSTKSNYLADGNAVYFLVTSFVFDKVIQWKMIGLSLILKIRMIIGKPRKREGSP
jgi:hypothetical protein